MTNGVGYYADADFVLKSIRKEKELEQDLASKKLLTVIETGKVLGIGRIKVYELIKGGFLPALNIGGLKVRREAIDEFLTKYEGYDFSNIKNIVKMNS